MTRTRWISAALAAALLAVPACSSTTGDTAPPASASGAGTSPGSPPTAATGPAGTTPAPPSTPLPAPAPVTPPNPASADANDPDSTSRVVLALMYEIDTTRDKSFSDGLRRAVPLLSSDYAVQVSNAPSAKPDAKWRLWAQHQAYTAAETTPSPEDRPADTDTAAYRAYELTVKPIGRDGWTGDPDIKIALVTLLHTAGGWVVKQIDYS
jgi:hypothetical protein